MIKLFTTNQIRSLDGHTIASEPIASVDLMERASQTFVRAFENLFHPDACRVIVLAGAGNNGGDALAIARLLSLDAYRTEVILYNPGKLLSTDCEINKRRLHAMPEVKFVETQSFIPLPALDSRCVVIDGLFGSGLNRPLAEEYAGWFEYIRSTPAKVVSIDIPSGLFGEDNTDNRKAGDPNSYIAIKADRTLTFQFPKLSFLLPENEKYTGEWQILDIGLSKEAIDKMYSPYFMLERQDISRLLKKRNKFAHKGNFGHALLIAGSYGKMGAALLSAKACLRTGAGLLTVHVPQKGVEVLQTALPEAMVSVDPDTFIYTAPPSTDTYSCAGIGPGIGTQEAVKKALLRLLQSIKKPLVLDADALNILSTSPEHLRLIPPGSILTPHPKEFDRMAGNSTSSWQRLHKAMKLAVDLKSCIVLKGAWTAICTPSGTCYFNPTGNPGMATAGSGDVLTGMILSLLAQSYSPEEAAMTAVYLHGMAGDSVVAAGKQSQESLIAGDIIEEIGKCFHLLYSSCHH
jgi:NAD(P)H-hydrate epimerase